MIATDRSRGLPFQSCFKQNARPIQQIVCKFYTSICAHYKKPNILLNDAFLSPFLQHTTLSAFLLPFFNYSEATSTLPLSSSGAFPPSYMIDSLSFAN